MKIYRDIAGVKTQLHDIEIDQQTELRQSISGEDLIVSRFTLTQKIDLQLGDYVEFKDSVYTILDEPQIKKEQNSFSYNIEFKSDQYILKNVQVMLDDESEFFYYGDAIDMISLIIANLNRVYTDGAYYADYVEQVEPKNINFRNENCLSAIQRLASEFECEFTVKGKKITFRKKIGEDTGLVFEYKKELRSIERQTLQNAELLTVLYPYGSERNITNEYGTKRLKIPKLENNTEIFRTIERSVFFDDIYPRLKGNVSQVFDDIYAFSDTGIDFNINSQLIGGVKAKVIFNTGDLAGREFEIYRYTDSTKKVELVPYTDDTGLELPNATFKPRIGDKYVFVDIKMPQTYIDNAEAELLEKATEYLEKYSQPNVIYKVDPHYPALRKSQQHLNLGDIITLKDADFGIEFKTRILKLNQKVHNEFEYKLDIGNQVTVSYFTQVMTDNKNIRNNIYLNEKYIQEQFNRVYNNLSGFSAPLYVNRGLFDANNFYYNNQNRRDYVYRVNIDGQKEWYFYIGEDHQKAEWIGANWQYIDSQFEIIATETLLAENANIGDWIIQDGQIVSQNLHNGQPKAQLNGLQGFLKFISKWTYGGEWVKKEMEQVMKVGSDVDGIQAVSTEVETGQVNGRSELSSRGIYADFAGIDPFKEDLLNDASLPDGLGAVVGIGKAKYSVGDYIAGVIGWAENLLPNNIPAFGGVFWGLKSFGRYKGLTVTSETTYAVKKYDEFISCYNTARLELSLPESPVEGREIEVRRNVGEVRVTSPDKYLLRDGVVDNVFFNRGDVWTFLWDGRYWLCNVKVRL